MEDENQIVVPPSFLALFQDRRGRLQEPPALVRERYELCEDMASSLVERALQLQIGRPAWDGFKVSVLRHAVPGWNPRRIDRLMINVDRDSICDT